jgi:aconitate hydratase
MGVLPMQFADGTNAQTLDLDGSEIFGITGLSDAIEPGQMVTLEITRKNGKREAVPVKLRIDTPIEIDYYRHGGILPFVLRELMARQ